MNKIIAIFFSVQLVLIFSLCKTTYKKVDKVDFKLLTNELISRGYHVKIRTDKSPYSVVTAYPKTNVLDGDFQKICSIPDLTFFTMDKENLPTSFFGNLNGCELESIDYLNLRNLSFQEGVLCKLIVKKTFQKSLFLTNTNVSDADLACIRNVEKIDNLSLKGPAQKFTDEAFCNLMHSGIKLKSVDLRILTVSEKVVNCLLDLKDIEYFSFRKIKGRTADDMKKFEDLYFKRNGRKVIVDVFEYDSP